MYIKILASTFLHESILTAQVGSKAKIVGDKPRYIPLIPSFLTISSKLDTMRLPGRGTQSECFRINIHKFFCNTQSTHIFIMEILPMRTFSSRRNTCQSMNLKSRLDHIQWTHKGSRNSSWRDYKFDNTKNKSKINIQERSNWQPIRIFIDPSITVVQFFTSKKIKL